jgi:serine/threonine-protein phosphatase 2B regulatory subunit
MRQFRQLFVALGISNSAARAFWDLFCLMDEDGSGEVSLVEMLDFFDIDRTRFAKRVFSMFDEDGSGEVDFREFVTAVWIYCTFTKSGLITFAFNLYDLDGSGAINERELENILREVYGKEFQSNAYANKVMKKLIAQALTEDPSGEISRELFEVCAAKMPALLFPAFQMQQILQKKIMGDRFWSSMAKGRQDKYGDEMDMKQFLEKITEEAFKEFVEEDMRERVANARADDILGGGTGRGGAAERHEAAATSVRRALEGAQRTGRPRTMASKTIRGAGTRRPKGVSGAARSHLVVAETTMQPSPPPALTAKPATGALKGSNSKSPSRPKKKSVRFSAKAEVSPAP